MRAAVVAGIAAAVAVFVISGGTPSLLRLDPTVAVAIVVVDSQSVHSRRRLRPVCHVHLQPPGGGDVPADATHGVVGLLPRDDDGCVRCVKLVDTFESEYVYITSGGADGRDLYFRTNLAAPKNRIIRVTIPAPARGACRRRPLLPSAASLSVPHLLQLHGGEIRPFARDGWATPCVAPVFHRTVFCLDHGLV